MIKVEQRYYEIIPGLMPRAVHPVVFTCNSNVISFLELFIDHHRSALFFSSSIEYGWLIKGRIGLEIHLHDPSNNSNSKISLILRIHIYSYM